VFSGKQEMEASEKIYWTKLAAAIGMAVLTLVLQVYLNVEGMILFMLGALLYMGLSDLISNMNGVERTRGIKIGIGAFFFTWMVIWILLYTVVQTMA
jgi:hypothetical protein